MFSHRTSRNAVINNNCEKKCFTERIFFSRWIGIHLHAILRFRDYFAPLEIAQFKACPLRRRSRYLLMRRWQILLLLHVRYSTCSRANDRQRHRVCRIVLTYARVYWVRISGVVCPLYIHGLLGPGPKSADFPDVKPLLLEPRAEIREREGEIILPPFSFPI